MSGVVLALGGGGARALAHVGVLEVLRREAIPIVAVAGTSMGALIGAMYAAGLPPAIMREDVRRVGRAWDLLRLVDVAIRPGSIALKGSKLTEFLAERVGHDLRIESLRIPFAAMAVDVLTGRDVALRTGPVVEAVRASLSFPGLFEPVERDGLRLVDGGVLDNLPVDVARRLAPGAVVAVDVLPAFGANTPGEAPVVGPLRTPLATRWLDDLVQVQLAMVSELVAHRVAASPPDVMVRPMLPDDITVLTGFGRGDEAIRAGIEATEESLGAIRAVLESRAGGRS